MLTLPYCPYRFRVPPLGRQSTRLSAVCPHRPNLRTARAVRVKHDVRAAGREHRVLVAASSMRQLHELLRGDVHDKNIEITGLEPAGPGKGDVLALRI